MPVPRPPIVARKGKYGFMGAAAATRSDLLFSSNNKEDRALCYFPSTARLGFQGSMHQCYQPAGGDKHLTFHHTFELCIALLHSNGQKRKSGFPTCLLLEESKAENLTSKD